jgi:methylmalonyl-CoA mutase
MSNENTSGDPLSGVEEAPGFSEFSPASYEAWRSAAEKTLKGAPFEKKLVSRTYEGIELQPLYRQEDIERLPHLDSLPGFTPYVRGSHPLGHTEKPWEVAQEYAYSTPGALNEALLADLGRGLTAVNLSLDPATRLGLDVDAAPAESVGRGGVSVSSLDDLGKALNRIDLEATPLFVQAGAMGLPFAALLVALVRKQAKSPERLRGCVGMDPLGVLGRDGNTPRSLERSYDEIAQFTSWAIANAPQLQTISVASHPYHDAGGTVTQELAFALATGVEYLRAMQARGLSIDEVAPRMRFVLSISSQCFMEIAKLRAARPLWAKAVKAFGGGEQAQKLSTHARTSTWNKTKYDPYVNMLRTTVEAFAGVIGGCDSLHVGPFDEIARLPDEFSRRIARNTHIILREECHVDRTVDPAGGSWYVETLTHTVAKKAWETFQEVEKQGGMYKALLAGFPQSQVAGIAAQRAKSIAARKDIFVGTNMYANMKDTPLPAPQTDWEALRRERARELAEYREATDQDWRQGALDKLAKASPDKVMEAAIHAASGGATLGDLSATLGAGDTSDTPIEALRTHRGSELFEELRDAARAFAEKTGSPPKVFLANLGPLAQHKARSDFSRGFLEIGGFDVMGDTSYPDAAAAANGALESQAPIVVICSTDAAYPDFVPPLTRQIKAAKPDTTVLLAGYPPDHVEAFKQAGVDNFIHLRANCYDMLVSLQKKVGVLS